MACLSLLIGVPCTEGRPYPSAANAWPAWKGVLNGKRVGLVIHRSSTIGDRLMPEVLLESGVDIRLIMVPEHGLRGEYEAGAAVGDYVDLPTGLPVVSLYGKRKAPEPVHTDSLDIVVLDLQDVGVRFYTYLSTLHYVMESCARASIPLLVLDRPNVNDYTVDGPVLDSAYRSFVGMHPIPVMHGMTLGELARMIKGERWTKGTDSLDLQVWPMEGYRRGLRLQPPLPPSPNLRDSLALEWYPTLCFLEGCPVSVGRGTSSPFTLIGSPWLSRTDTCFVPQSMPGRSVKPLFMNQVCCGISMKNIESIKRQDVTRRRAGSLGSHNGLLGSMDLKAGLRIEVLQWLYKDYEMNRKASIRYSFLDRLKSWINGKARSETSAAIQSGFFDSFFDLLAGGPGMRLAIIKGQHVSVIRDSWQPGIRDFKKMRVPYLLYPEQ